MATKTEDGVEYPESDYCYVGDPDVVSTWKLRVTATPGGEPDAAIVGAAAAALGPGGFRGQQVDIPESDRPAAVACVRRAWRSAHPDMDASEMPPGIQERAESDDLATSSFDDVDLVVRSMEKREIEARIVPWDVVVDTPIGLEAFMPGSFTHVDPKKVVLQSMEHGPAAGRGLWLEERADGAYMGFRVSKTQVGDELLVLASDGVTQHVSVVYDTRRSQAEMQTRAGRRFTALTKVDLRAVSTTWKPYYQGAVITQVRAQEDIVSEPAAPEATIPEAPTSSPALDITPLQTTVAQLGKSMESSFAGFAERMERMEERSRADFLIPSSEPEKKVTHLYHWASYAFRTLVGERPSQRELQERALDDVISTDNPGAVPDAFIPDVIGVIDPMRPFCQTTRQIPVPDSGMSIVVPVLGTRATTAVQTGSPDNEKSEIDSTAPTVTTQSFDAITIAGGADISIQLIRRSTPSFLELLMQELAEAYAADCDAQAIAALIAATVSDGGTVDPEALLIGDAWGNSLTYYKRPPTNMWMSSAAVQQFIDAKADGTNAPLYSSLQADFTVGSGVGGRVSGLLPVYVPALDATAVDVLIGPSAGFAWAEDGSFTLQVDVPSKLGRDVALAGILFPMPRYPLAFTKYALAS